MADPPVDGTRQHNFAILDFSKRIVLIGGTGYTGEIKKGIFSALNFILPMYKNCLPMHCSANVGKDGDTAIFFGLSGTGKTTLSTDPHRKLIGDDEHGWTEDDKVFNFEGGCYAKAIHLCQETEPAIYGAIRKGALLENVILDARGAVDFDDTSFTQNTRVIYPIYNIKSIPIPSIGKNSTNIFSVTANASAVLRPISKLSPSQAAYQSMSGYTATGTVADGGVVVPIPNFSSCIVAPILPLDPSVYAETLSKTM